MPRLVRYLLILGVAAASLLVLTATVLRGEVERRLETNYPITVEAVDIPTDPASIERGEHLVSTVFFCQECHGEDLGGELYFDDPFSGHVSAKNLTTGQGGVASSLSDGDWVRAIRHGLDPDGYPLIVMPSNSYYQIGDRDLGAIIAYLKSLPPVENELPARQLGLLTYLTLLTDSSLIPAETIDHAAARPAAPQPALSAEYGQYLATACTICHGPDLKGGPTAGAGLDLTQTGDLEEWNQEQFIETVRSGTTPKGVDLNPQLMPWKRVGNMTDDELGAIWMFLQTLP